MKKLFFTLALISAFAACKNGAEWSAADKQQWMQVCTGQANQMDEASAKNYCSCMLDKLQQKFKNYEEMNTKGTTQDGIDAGKACLQTIKKNNGNGGNGTGNILGNGGNGGNNGGGGWQAADEQKFMNTCVQNAKNAGGDEQTAKAHCQCTLGKIEKKFNSYSEADRTMTPAEVTAMEQECNQEGNGNN